MIGQAVRPEVDVTVDVVLTPPSVLDAVARLNVVPDKEMPVPAV